MSLQKTNKKIAVTKLNYGLGKNQNLKFKKFSGINTRLNCQFINRAQFKSLKRISKKMLLNKILKEAIKNNIEFIEKLRSYKGVRHKLKYPCRGQRTHTNAKTIKKFKI